MFSNREIDRSLPVEARVEVLEALVRSGDARWLDAERTAARVVDSADIARYEDALRAYGISGSVYTVDELARELGVDSERARSVRNLLAPPFIAHLLIFVSVNSTCRRTCDRIASSVSPRPRPRRVESIATHRARAENRRATQNLDTHAPWDRTSRTRASSAIAWGSCA